MKHTRIIVTHYDGPEALQATEEECPQPKDGEVRVKVLAAGVALPDVMAREGIHPETASSAIYAGLGPGWRGGQARRWRLWNRARPESCRDADYCCEIKPLIAQRFPLGEARYAHELLGKGGVIGKIVLVMSSRLTNRWSQRLTVVLKKVEG